MARMDKTYGRKFTNKINVQKGCSPDNSAL